MENGDLVREFAAAAREMGAAVLDSEVSHANRIFDRLKAIDHYLRKRGTAARLELASLLGDRNRFVQYYAAEYLLGLLPEIARAIIEKNAKHYFDALAADARGLLRAFDSGKYKPD